jgi:hypothetical protein
MTENLPQAQRVSTPCFHLNWFECLTALIRRILFFTCVVACDALVSADCSTSARRISWSTWLSACRFTALASFCHTSSSSCTVATLLAHRSSASSSALSAALCFCCRVASSRRTAISRSPGSVLITTLLRGCRGCGHRRTATRLPASGEGVPSGWSGVEDYGVQDQA